MTGGVHEIVLDRPTKANALSAELVDQLHAGLDEAQQAAARTVVFRSTARQFCAGFDLGNLAEETDATLLHRFCRLGLLLERLYEAPFATVAVVTGAAVGAGADLALACDHRIGSEHASFRFPGAAFGAVLGTRRLAQVTSVPIATRLAASAEVCRSSSALRYGLLTELLPADEIAEGIGRIVAELAALPDGTTSQLMRAARGPDAGGAVVADLVRSLVAEPGLRDRIDRYRSASTASVPVRESER
ncbi:enoyl-CoA hydratase/carnithine racemase [Tamaricihabitans halophyticus]|uniref:Enoyl-CoA hydratase/carnithine racemase n=1 Tax=Tamaricihabitans halophyticus TaxID=1262583 RepID=A0A4R2QHJ6_9PSEU|nr:enoyl-CoA hydratase/isomerase family protein [Tamaricihabitans halophyticus]TCP47828.1 enoyl-CoA hydratase/carnithine racemase [Tamaricihabitans halophyticus]